MTESNISLLTAAQSTAVRRVDDAVTAFYKTDIRSDADVRTAHSNVVSAARELGELFPEIQANADTYYNSATPHDPYNMTDGYNSPMFDLMIDLIRFDDVTEIEEFCWLFQSFNETLPNLARFCDNYDVSSATWVD